MILYLVQPLWGRSILAQDALRDTMIRDCRRNFPEHISFMHTTISPFAMSHTPLYYLGQSLIHLAESDAAVFCHGWQKYRDCIAVHNMARRFGKPLYELDRLEWAWDEQTQSFQKQEQEQGNPVEISCIELDKHFYQEHHETTLFLNGEAITSNYHTETLPERLAKAFPSVQPALLQELVEAINQTANDADFQALQVRIQELIKEDHP